jgi:hypothetical protein
MASCELFPFHRVDGPLRIGNFRARLKMSLSAQRCQSESMSCKKKKAPTQSDRWNLIFNIFFYSPTFFSHAEMKVNIRRSTRVHFSVSWLGFGKVFIDFIFAAAAKSSMWAHSLLKLTGVNQRMSI